MDTYRHCQRLLDRLERVLRDLGYWQSVSPSDAALASTEPFALDTLECHQWLQWIFIAKMRQLVLLQQPLPNRFQISPYVEEAMRQQSGVAEILLITRELDQLFQ